MAVEHLGSGLHMAAPHDPYYLPHRAPTAMERTHYFEPIHTAQTGPVYHHRPYSPHEVMTGGFDAEALDPVHIFHSAEQLPPRYPRAFDERYEDAQIALRQMPLPKYHAKGSPHAHADY